MRSPRAAVVLLGLTAVALSTVAAVPARPAGAAVAADAPTEIVYSSYNDRRSQLSVVIRDLETRRATVVIPRVPSAEQRLLSDPELSPDGTRIVVSQFFGGQDVIVVMNRDGSGFRQLSFPRQGSTLERDTDPTWSPDGRTILFTRSTLRETPAEIEGLSTDLFTVRAVGGDASALSGGAGGYTADYSPDGTQIAFGVARPPRDDEPFPVFDLAVVAADGTGSRRSLGVQGDHPAWSPDGRTIAYSTRTERDPSQGTDPADIYQLAVVPAAGGAPRVLAATRPTAARSAAGSPAWTPDGRSLVFTLAALSPPFFPVQLWAVDAQGVRAGRLIDQPTEAFQAFVRGPAPTPVVAAGPASVFTPVSPVRVLDTREGLGAPRATVGPAGRLDLRLDGVPASATAVVLNVTATNASSSTDVRVYPAGAGLPGASSLNLTRGQTVPNLVTVALGPNRTVSLRNAAGTLDLIADLAGYYTPANTGDPATGQGFTSLSPTRILDTRAGLGAPRTRLGAAGTLDLQVTGTLPGGASVPADASAVVLNLTGTDTTTSTDLRAYPTPDDAAPSGGGVPVVSNLNLTAGQTAANLVTVAVGAGGQIRLRNNSGQAAVIADVAGYYSPGSTGRFTPVVPTRMLDTRTGLGATPLPIPGGRFVDLQVAGAQAVPTGATAAVLTLTATGVTRPTDIRAYPAGSTGVPTVSNLNLRTGQTRANTAIVRTGTGGRIRIRNNNGQAFLIGDLTGYFTG